MDSLFFSKKNKKMDVPQGSAPYIRAGTTGTRFPPSLLKSTAHRMTYELDDEDDPRRPPQPFDIVMGMDFRHLYPSMYAGQQAESQAHFARLKAEYDALDGLIEAEALDLLVAEWSDWHGMKSDERVLQAIVTQGSLSLLKRALKTRLVGQIHLSDHRGHSPLFCAVKMRNLEKTRALLDAGAMIRCVDQKNGSYLIAPCPFELTIADESADMAVLLLTAQGRPFPDGHDEGCCKYLSRHTDEWPPNCWTTFETRESPDQARKREHIMRCGQEIHERRTRSTDAFYPFLHCLKRAMAGHNAIVYREMVLPILRELWRTKRYDACWKITEAKK